MLSIVIHIFNGCATQTAGQGQRVYTTGVSQRGRTWHQGCRRGCAPKSSIGCERGSCRGGERENCTEWCPARINRQTAIDLERIDKIALTGQQFFIFAVRDRGHNVEILSGDVPIATHKRGLINVTTALFGHIGEGIGLQALEVCSSDKVDHPADGVSTINCRCPILQHVDALHGRNWQLVDVDRAAIDPVRCHTPTVEEDKRPSRTLAAQVCERAAPGTTVFGHIGIGRQIVDPGHICCQIGDQLLRARNTFALEVIAIDNLQRQGAGLHLSANARARHNNGLDRFGLGVSRGRRVLS